MVLGIVMILISLLIPATTELRREARRRVCQSEMRQLAVRITIYCDGNSGVFPLPLERASSDMWRTRTGLVLTPLGALGAASYWPMSMFDEFGNTMYDQTLLCPEDSFSLEYRAWAAAELGVPVERVQAGAMRVLSRSLYLDPRALQGPRGQWENWFFRVATLHEAQFPSHKAMLVEIEPFHNVGYFPTSWPVDFSLMVSAIDGSADWRHAAEATPPVELAGVTGHGFDPRMAAFQLTRDGVRGFDW